MRFKIIIAIFLAVTLAGCACKNKNEMRPSVAGILHICPQNTIALVQDNTKEISYSLPHTIQLFSSLENTFLEKLQKDLGLLNVEGVKLLTIKNNLTVGGYDEIIFTAISYQQPETDKIHSDIVFFTPKKIEKLLEDKKINKKYQPVIEEYIRQTKHCVPCLNTCAVGSVVKEYNSPTLWKPIKKFAEIDEKELQERTLVLVDIDNTLLRSANHYGSNEYFSHKIHDIVRKENISLSEAIIRFYEQWIYSQQVIKTKLIDPNVRSFIQKAVKNKAHVFYFTARQPSLHFITYNQLENHGLNIVPERNFVFETSYKNVIFPDRRFHQKNSTLEWENPQAFKYDISPVFFYKNIIFTHDFNKKGIVFKDFFKKYVAYLKAKNIPIPTKIMLIDDKMHNIVSMDQAAYELGIEFVGYHISDDFIYDHTIGLREEMDYLKE